MSATIILPEWLVTSALKKPKHAWGVRIVDDTIDDIAPNEELLFRYPTEQAWIAPGQVLASGFVNSHIHIYGALAHGIPLAKAPSGFWPFLEDFWWPLVENRLDHEMIRATTELRCAQLLKSGVTSFFDVTEAPNALPGCLEVQAEIVRKWGLRGVLTFEACQRISEENGRLGLKENTDFIDSCAHHNDLVSGAVSIHTTFTCSKEFIQEANQLAKERNVLLHAHVSEGTYEPEYTLKTFGMRTMHYYHQLGITGPDFLASQCVQLDPSEVDLIAQTGVRVSHMPLSNCEVGGGIAPIPQLIEAGATVGLGSDGYIDDFFEVMRGAFLIHKANQLNPQVMPANLVWHMATEGGAQAIGLKQVGKIEKGWQADLQLIDGHLPTPLESHNFYDQLLLYRTEKNVQAVWVAGKLRVEKGEVIGADWEQIFNATHTAARRLWAETRK